MAEKSLDSLLDVNGVGESTIDDIRRAGFGDISELAGADRDDLKQISGIGSSTADNILRFLDQAGLRERDEITENQRKLQSLLRELFQFDVADLDFGIYRIMNQKRDVINDFIEEDLIQAVQEELAAYSETERAELEQEVEAAKQDVLENLPDDALDAAGRLKEEYREFPVGERYVEAIEKLESHQVSEDTEAQIFNDLYNFFRRYYENGDFVPKRRYSAENKYAVPYNGEETHFYWANQNQHFIKTSEHFTNYQFKTGGLSVSFELRNAHIETDNNKNDDRYFVLHRYNPIRYDGENDSILVLFEYRSLTDEDFDRYDTTTRSHDKQKDIREQIEDEILAEVSDSGANQLTQRAYNTSKRILEHHLHQYTTKNTTDYFIHKNLGPFFERELEFYIKNEVLELDGVTNSPEQIENELSRAKVVGKLGERVIEFIAQIEDFQRKLWEKKKFVTATEYCVTLDKLPERYYSRIAENEDQVAAWKQLYDLENDDQGLGRFTGEADINEEFLTDHQFMMVDTKFFDQEFKDELLSTITDLDQELDGILIKGENFQALNLLLEKYRERINCIYIDPPYNTGNEFIYKDNYQHSSWLSMIENRVSVAKDLLSDNGLFFSSIDDNELNNLTQLLNDILGEQVNLVVVRNNPKGRGLDQYLAKSHDYLLTYAKQPTELTGIPKSEDQIAEQYKQKDENGRYRLQPLRNTHREFNRETRPNLWYPLYVDPDSGEVHLESGNDRVEVYPLWSDGLEGCWTWDQDKARRDRDLLVGRESKGQWKVYRKDYAMQGGSAVTYTPKTIWDDNDLRTDHAQQVLNDIIGDQVFRAPKPPALIKRAIQLSSGEGEYVLDFFAGSGTTAQSVISLNRERDSSQKYILVDMGDHLSEVAKPRIQRIVYSDEWNEGSPQNMDGISHMFKYHEIESYDDSLDNISFTGERQAALDSFDDYLLKYMLEFETRKSETRLNIDQLRHPFQYQLRVTRDGETRTKTVDLPETFNYLLGLEVRTFESHEHQDRRYSVVRASKDEETVAVIWRKSEELNLEDEREFVEGELLSGDEDIVYINGDSLVSGARSLESVFKNRMEA